MWRVGAADVVICGVEKETMVIGEGGADVADSGVGADIDSDGDVDSDANVLAVTMVV